MFALDEKKGKLERVNYRWCYSWKVRPKRPRAGARAAQHTRSGQGREQTPLAEDFDRRPPERCTARRWARCSGVTARAPP